MKYPVINPLRHDGVDYAEGDTVELTAKEAKALAELEVIRLEGAKASEKPTK